MRSRAGFASLSFALAFIPLIPVGNAGAGSTRQLTFENRVTAQEAIERVYYGHQIDARRGFEEAVPRAVIEAKVRRSLAETVALEQFWNTPVTAAMLERELERMVEQSQMPSRLKELFAALGDDPVLVLECVARPALVNRLTRNFFRSDERIQKRGVVAWDDWWGHAHAAFDGSRVATVAPSDSVVRSWIAAVPESIPCSPDDTWANGVLDDAPIPRKYHSAVWTGTHMIVWGGWNGDAPDPGTQTNTGDRYDPATDTWSPISTLNAPGPKYQHFGFWTGSRMLVWGSVGDNSGGRYEPVGDTWQTTSTAGAPVATFGQTAIWTGSRMVVWGGDGLNTGAVYDPVDNIWSATSIVNAPVGRRNHSAVWTGNRMIVHGGVDSFGSTIFPDGGIYDPVANTWASMAGNLPVFDHRAAWAANRMVIWGGSSTGRVGGRYDPVTNTWSSVSSLNRPTIPSAGHTATSTGSKVIVFGVSAGPALSAGIYDPAADSWGAFSTTNAPSMRQSHTAVWTGDQAIIWGGTPESSPVLYNTGGRYVLASNSWTPTKTGLYLPDAELRTWTGTYAILSVDSPYPGSWFRYDPVTEVIAPVSSIGAPIVWFRTPTSHWTGSLVVVWDAAGRTGARYDPVADTWTPVSTLNSPDGRSSASQVWTGTEVIVWGGYQSTFRNTGARYNPATDTWVATSTVNTPTARWQHGAVWTGSRMLVWGGRVGCCDVADGSRYDPGTDSWTAMSVSGAPGARQFPTFNWTGSRAILWGGSSLNTGGRYDPVTDTWLPTATNNAPQGRLGHVSVWTGSRLVVWGGGGGTALNTGGRYDPVSDSWLATSTAGAPMERDGPTAVWTGSQMIVWGGNSWVGNPSRGGRYSLGNSTDDDGDGFSECAGDCNDASAASKPGGTEVCDNLDNDCDNQVDEGTRITLYRDVDGDSFGSPSTTTNACAAYPGWRVTAGDCDDAAATIYPGAPQSCNGINDNCSDPGWPSLPAAELDADGDSFRQCAECDDTRDTVYPGGPEFCDSLNNNCSDPAWPALPAAELDSDGDGFRVCDNDCNDGNPAINPSAVEVRADGADQDCDGQEICWRDQDEDDFGHPTTGVASFDLDCVDSGEAVLNTDCNDSSGSVFPGALEVVADGIDQNCDGAEVCYRDNDGDTYGTATTIASVDLDCVDAPESTNSLDCNDGSAAVGPAATEVCNGIDDDCDSLTDEDALGQDSDSDGVRNLCDNCRLAANANQIDSDLDRVGNACDNCVVVVNPDQSDPDSDALGTACDNCPALSNPAQQDLDADRAGDACDNCVTEYNESQSDGDFDGEGDVCDLDDGEIFQFRSDPLYIEWQGEIGPTEWNVYEGDLDGLGSAGEYTQAPGSNPLADRHCGVVDLYVADPEDPPSGKTIFTLVTGVTASVEGGLGTNSAGTPRPNSNPCP